MGETCYVYIIQCGDMKDAPIKIGFSNNPEYRAENLQTGCPYRLRVTTKIPMENRAEAEKLEKYLHGRLNNHRMVGEWFDTRKMRGKISRILMEYSSDNVKCLEKQKPEKDSASASERL